MSRRKPFTDRLSVNHPPLTPESLLPAIQSEFNDLWEAYDLLHKRLEPNVLNYLKEWLQNQVRIFRLQIDEMPETYSKCAYYRDAYKTVLEIIAQLEGR